MADNHTRTDKHKAVEQQLGLSSQLRSGRERWRRKTHGRGEYLEDKVEELVECLLICGGDLASLIYHKGADSRR
jgi:hypothetical protein